MKTDVLFGARPSMSLIIRCMSSPQTGRWLPLYFYAFNILIIKYSEMERGDQEILSMEKKGVLGRTVLEMPPQEILIFARRQEYFIYHSPK